MGRKYVFIKTANNDAYMNTVDNFRGCSHEGDTDVTLYFNAVAGANSSGAYDSIPLVITSEKEQEVMEFIGAALSGGASTGMVVIADDVAGKYVNGNISSVGTITRGATGNRKVVEALTNGSAITRTLLASESGKLFTLDLSTVDNDITLTLPAASTSAGVFYDFVNLVDSDDDADFVLKTDGNSVDFYGGIITGGANSTLQDVDGDASKLTQDGSGATTVEGTRFTVLCDGANWHLSGYTRTVIGTAQIALSATA